MITNEKSEQMEDDKKEKKQHKHDRSRKHRVKKDGDKQSKRGRHDDHNDSDDHYKQRKKRHRGDQRKKHKKRDRERSRSKYFRDDDTEQRHRSKRKKKKDRKDRHSKEHETKKRQKTIHSLKKEDDKNVYPLGNISNLIPEEKLNVDTNYFSHHSHFRFFLHRMMGGIHFEDLSSDEARAKFQNFSEEYNKGKLPTIFYEKSIPSEAMEQCRRTQHTWSFQMKRTEEQTLKIVKAGVQKQTEYNAKTVN